MGKNGLLFLGLVAIVLVARLAFRPFLRDLFSSWDLSALGYLVIAVCGLGFLVALLAWAR